MSKSLTINAPQIVQTRNTLNAVPSGSTAEPDYSVKFVPQDLTEAQQAQARQNIGAVSASEVAQANWNETDPTDPSYIQNKPAIVNFEEYNTLTFNLSSQDYVKCKRAQHNGGDKVTIYIDGVLVYDDIINGMSNWQSTDKYAKGFHVMQYKTGSNFGGIWAQVPENAVEHVSMLCNNILKTGANYSGNSAVVVPYPGQTIPATGSHSVNGGIQHVVQTTKNIANDVQIENYYVLTEAPATKKVTTFYVPQGTKDAWLEANPTKTVYEYKSITYPDPGTIVMAKKTNGDNPIYQSCIPHVILYNPQVQSDWNQSDTTAVDYIKNKPEISNRNLILSQLENKNTVKVVIDGGSTVTVTAKWREAGYLYVKATNSITEYTTTSNVNITLYPGFNYFIAKNSESTANAITTINFPNTFTNKAWVYNNMQANDRLGTCTVGQQVYQVSDNNGMTQQNDDHVAGMILYSLQDAYGWPWVTGQRNPHGIVWANRDLPATLTGITVPFLNNLYIIRSKYDELVTKLNASYTTAEVEDILSKVTVWDYATQIEGRIYFNTLPTLP